MEYSRWKRHKGGTMNRWEKLQMAAVSLAACALMFGGCGGGGGGSAGSGQGGGNLQAKSVNISTGWHHTCAVVSTGGTRELKCWGDNAYGELGDGTQTDSTTPVSVKTAQGTPLQNVTAVSASRYYTCALTGDGHVWCWGYNEGGKLGDGKLEKSLGGTLNASLQQYIPFDDENISTVPVEVVTDANIPLSGVVQISAGSWHACALINDGTVKCWGQNFDGALGIGKNPNDFNATNALSDKNEFQKLFWPYAITVAESNTSNQPLTDVVQVAAGSSDHTCALLGSGKVKCWAWNGGADGELGIDDTSTDFVTAPADFVKDENGSDLSDVKMISIGGDFTCALLSSGSVKCWGWNPQGQLGNESTTSVSHAVSVKDENGNNLAGVKEIVSERGNHTCALMNDGKVKCWGDNTHGQLGTGTLGSYEAHAVNVDLSNIDGNVTALAVGGGGRDPLASSPVQYDGDHTCILTDTGKVYCWGSNDKGQLGDGTRNDSSTPLEVHGL
jgi:alpha-tubulin suppressor-like RCC1 family protein